MNCPNCKNENSSPRRCPNCGHRFAHDTAIAAAIDQRSKQALELLPRQKRPRNVVDFSTGKAVQS